ETVDWKYYENSMEAVNELKMQGYKIASVEQADGSISLEKFNFNVGEKLALIFGNEVKGVLESLVEISDYVIEIPQFGTKHSINISVSIGVVIWDLISKMQR
ncbi:MAG: TrmH family RNA methyltransferase, partial [Cyclobacteriaceae bacterium]|nr:TrmH family RNA methyltransferase [Cyclobacteriaceae bacterium]